MFQQILVCESLRIPGHIQKQGNGIFHRFKVANIQNPHFFDSIVVGKPHLFPEILYRCAVEQFAVAWSTYIVHMVVHAPASGMKPLFRIRQAPYIAPVIIAQQQCDIFRHTQPLIVVIEHLLI